MHRRPAPLLPATAARLVGFALLALVGALKWQEMAEAATATQALSWVAAGLAAAGLLLATALAPARLRTAAAAGAALGALGLATAVSGLDLGLLRPSRWDELGDGLLAGTDALGGARLPYRGADPWPGTTLGLSGALLVTLAALAAFWPRGTRRGWPLASLCLLLILVVCPVVALAGRPSLALGILVAVPTACFLFLERVPGRPGAGAAVLAVVALAVALPLGAAADREKPWFDYRAFAESLGPVEPISFRWEHGYGPIEWPRDGRELFRVRTDTPAYWKARVLERFDGVRWLGARGPGADPGAPSADLAETWHGRDGWSQTARITLRRLQTDSVVAPGTILDLRETPRNLRVTPVPGRWLASRELGRGDSYVVRSHVPRPSTEQLSSATTGWDGRQAEQLALELPLRPGAAARAVELRFAPFGLGERPTAHYPEHMTTGDGSEALPRTHYRRTWRLARRLREHATNAFDYVLRVNAHLRSGPFRYTERPRRPRPGVPPLEAFLHDTREGYCQHFSGAMALLLRMGGVPARVATGFSPGGFRRQRGEWVVRDVDAHSWVEAWFDDIGWVTFDPTPAATPARSQTAAIDTPEYETPAAAGADGLPGADRQPTPRRAPGAPGAEPAEVAASPGGGGGAGDALPWLLGVAAAAGGLLLLARRSTAASADPLAELERALRRAGRPLVPGTTLARLERELGESAYVQALRRRRYAPGGSPPPTAADRVALRRALAAGRGWRGRLIALRAVPPRPFRRPDLDSNQGPTP